MAGARCRNRFRQRSSNFTYDSLMPLGGLVAIVNMQLAEIVFRGVGSGLYGMLVFAILTVFLAGRSSWPRAAFAVVAKSGVATLTNSGPHGFSEIL